MNNPSSAVVEAVESAHREHGGIGVGGDFVECECGSAFKSVQQWRAHFYAEVARAAEVAALRAAADAWVRGQWSDALPLSSLGVKSIGVAQDVADWLRARADEIEGGRS